jgi:CHAT domain-containing protein
MAYLQFLMGRYNAALEGYYQAREWLEQLGSDQLVAWCNLEIAEILLALNAFDEAAENAATARGRFAELGMPYESAKATLIAGLAQIGAGQIEHAAHDLDAARDAFAAIGNSTFTAQVDLYLAELAIRKRDADEALRRAGDALRVFARQGLATRAAYAQLIQARAAYDQGERVRAGRLARAALLRVEGRLAPAVAYQCHHLIGVIERARGRSHPALESFRRAVETVERMRGGIAADEFKASFLRDKIEVYEDAIAACLDRGDQAHIDEAFRLVESSKSRALADLLARYLRGSVDQTERPGSKGLEAETRARLLKLVEDLNWYSSQAGLEDDKGGQRSATVAERYRQKIIRCERQIAQLFRRLEASTSRFAEIHGMQSDSARDLCQALEPNETAIEYFTTGDQVSAFVATSDRFQVVRGLASRREVEAILTALRFQVEKFNYGPRFADEHFEQLNGAINRHLIQLYEAVFDRVEGHVGGERLMIIPHGPLHYVPFHALLDRRGYLIDRFEVSYAPSATVLRLCRQRDSFSRARRRAAPGRTSDGKLVALGVADRETPSIELEVQALGSIFSDAVTLTGADATRSNLLKFAPQARFLHLASHGYFRRDNPMFSFLKLADSQLNFYSLLDLKLKAEMVTLSACHTGVNMVFPGDELHGLMRGFLYAGAPSLVASLWAANDVSTAEFMKVMYSQVRAGRSKRAALRAAQLAIKDAYGHPYYWAPFVLMGNPN